jgi:hypothetical protein
MGIFTPPNGGTPFVAPDQLFNPPPPPPANGGTMGMVDDAAAPLLADQPPPPNGGIMGMVADAAAPALPPPGGTWRDAPGYQSLPPQLQAVADGIHQRYGLALQPPPQQPTPPAPQPTSTPAPAPEKPLSQLSQDDITRQQLEAAKAEADAASAEHRAKATALEAGIAEQQRMQAELDKSQNERRAVAEDKQRTVDALAKQAEDYKFDHGRFWSNSSTGQKIGWLVSVALSGIGDAFNHVNRPNPVLEMLQQRIKQDVDEQFAARDQLRQKAANAEHSLDRYNTLTKDIAAQKSAAMGQAQILVGKQMELAALKQADPQLQAAGMAKAAAFKQAGYNSLQEAQQRAVDNKFKEQQLSLSRGQLGLGYAQLNQSARFHQDELDEKKREFDLRLAEAAEKARAAGDEKSAKLAEAQAKDGIYDARTARPLVQPEGKPLLDQADKLDLAAEKATDPAQQQQLRAQAAAKRAEAATQHGFRSPEAKELREVISAGQTVVDVLAETRKAVEAGPSSFDREQWADIKARFKAAKIRYAESLGVKPGPKEMEALDDIFGGDPAKMTDRWANKGKMVAAVSALERDVIGATTTKLKAYGYRGDWMPSNNAGVEKPVNLSGMTGEEINRKAESNRPSALQQAILYPMGAPASIAQAQGNVPMTASGLQPGDEKTVQRVIAEFQGAANVDQRNKALGQLTAWSGADRPGISWGVLNTVFESGDKALYRKLAESLPDADQRAVALARLKQQDMVNPFTGKKF